LPEVSSTLSPGGDLNLVIVLAWARIAKGLFAATRCGLSACRRAGKANLAIVLLLLTGFPSRRILGRHAARNAAVLAMNDSWHGTAQPGLVFGIELREFSFADVFNVLFHVFWVR